MEAIYKSSILLFVFNRIIWGVLSIILSAVIIATFSKGYYLVTIVFAVLFLISSILFIKTVRVSVYSDRIKIAGIFVRKDLAYSSLRWVAQIPMMAPKTVFMRTNSCLPMGFYIYPVTSFVFFDDLLNMDVHDSVEYINTRILASE